MTRTVADVVVETLAEAGAKRCYGVPGDTLNFVTDAIRRSSIRWVHVRHEEAGGFAAGADALGFDFPQEVDFKQVYKACSVFCDEVRTPSQARRMTAMAAQAALAHRGVAVLILPVDVSRAPAPDGPAFAVHRAAPVTRPSDAELDQIAKALNDGGKVAIYGGRGCEHAHDQVVALAERLKAPVARTSRAKDFLEPDNPYDVGMTGIFGTAGGYHALMSCDTLLLLGCDFAWRQFYPGKAKIIQVDIEGAHLGRRHPVDIGVVGDIAPTIEALLPRLSPRESRSFLDEALAHAKKAVAALEKRAVAGKSGVIHPQYLTELIARHAARDAVFTADAGSPMVWCLRYVPATGANRTVISLTHGTMANAMPQALGAQAAFPGRQVISLSGDGGLAMLLGDLLTAVQEKLPIKVALYDNGSLGFVELEQKVEGLLDTYTGLVNPDFARVAEAMGLWGRRVERPDELESAVEAWLAAPGPALLDVLTDRYELVLPPVATAEQIFGMALYSAKGVLAGRGEEVAALIENAVVT